MASSIWAGGSVLPRRACSASAIARLNSACPSRVALCGAQQRGSSSCIELSTAKRLHTSARRGDDDGISRLISQDAATTTSQPKRPSPYRLLPPHTFLARFAPLHVAGWRLDFLPGTSAENEPRKERYDIEDGMVDLQDRRLVRLFEFEEGREGWGDLMRLVARVGEAVAKEDHHPSILICPTRDYPADRCMKPAGSSGYILEVSTHTHTPLPVSKEDKGSLRMRPGVTGKDMALAETVEQIWRDVAKVVLI